MPYALRPTPPGTEPHDPRRGGRVQPAMVPQYDAMGRPTGAMIEDTSVPTDPWDLAFRAAKAADDGMRMVANGMTFGQADRLAGLGDYATGRAESYDAGAKAQFDRTQKVREEHPTMAPVAEFAGGLLTGGGLVKNGVTIAGREGRCSGRGGLRRCEEGGPHADGGE